MMKSLKNIVVSPDTRKRVILTLIILFIIRIFSNIPVIGINRNYLHDWATSNSMKAFAFMDIFNGSALSHMSLFAIGIGGYISASIAIQLLSVFVPYLSDLTKQGQEGVKQIKKITFYTSIGVSFLQGLLLANQLGKAGLLIKYNIFYILVVAIMLTIGAMIVYGFSVIIENKGVGNGTTFIIATNIIYSLYTTVGVVYEMYIDRRDVVHAIINGSIAIAILVALIIGVIYYNEGEKRIGVTYAGSNKYLPSSKSYLPIKLAMSSVMPAIITMSILQIFASLPSFLGLNPNGIVCKILNVFNYGYWFEFDGWRAIYNIGIIFFVFMMIGCNYFYSKIVYNPKIIADNLQASNGVINGIRQNKIAEYIEEKSKNIIILGGIFLSIIILIPMFISKIGNMNVGLGGTSVIILVSACIDIYKSVSANAQIEQNSTIGFYNKGKRKYEKA